MSLENARVLIVAGEASGDLYGSLVMRAMSGSAGTGGAPISVADAGASGPRGGGVQFMGIGGPAMREAGLAPVGDAGAIGVTGFFEVLGSAGAIWRAYRAARVVLASKGRPDLVLLIDYPDFNLRLAAKARKAGIPVLYFVSPQVWAWRKGRVRQIAASVNRMLVILPFEEPIYRNAGVAVEFVGHPLLDLVRTTRTRDQTLRPLGLDPHRPVVALLPGSRRNELLSHLGIMLDAARRLRREFRDLQFLIPVAPTLDGGSIESVLREERRRAAHEDMPGAECVLVREGRYDALAACDAAVVASGTATLETALLGVPMVIVYRMNPVTFALARLISDVPAVGMPNLIVGRRIVPELVQHECTPEHVAAEVRRILTDPPAAREMRQALSGVRSRLGRPGAIARVAAAAWDMIRVRDGAARDGGRGSPDADGTQGRPVDEHDRVRPGHGGA